MIWLMPKLLGPALTYRFPAMSRATPQEPPIPAPSTMLGCAVPMVPGLGQAPPPGVAPRKCATTPEFG